MPAVRGADVGKVFFSGSWASGLGLDGRAPRALMKFGPRHASGPRPEPDLHARMPANVPGAGEENLTHLVANGTLAGIQNTAGVL